MKLTMIILLIVGVVCIVISLILPDSDKINDEDSDIFDEDGEELNPNAYQTESSQNVTDTNVTNANVTNESVSDENVSDENVSDENVTNESVSNINAAAASQNSVAQTEPTVNMNDTQNTAVDKTQTADNKRYVNSPSFSKATVIPDFYNKQRTKANSAEETVPETPVSNEPEVAEEVESKVSEQIVTESLNKSTNRNSVVINLSKDGDEVLDSAVNEKTTDSDSFVAPEEDETTVLTSNMSNAPSDTYETREQKSKSRKKKNKKKKYEEIKGAPKLEDLMAADDVTLNGKNKEENIMNMYRKGLSILEISKILGLGVGEVKSVVDKYNN